MTPALLYGLVILSAIAHAVWNALVKSAGDRTLTMVAIRTVGMMLGLVALPFVDWPSRELEMARRHRRRDVCLLRAAGPLLWRGRHERRLPAGARAGARTHHGCSLPDDRRGLEHGPGRSRRDDLDRHHGLVLWRRRQSHGGGIFAGDWRLPRDL